MLAGLKENRAAPFLFPIVFLVLAQVVWWTFLFLQMTGRLEQLEVRVNPVAATEAHHQAIRRRWMFVSEAGFFAGVTFFGLFVLYRSLQKESRARAAEKTFVEVWSHESKTPLTALKLRLESIQERYPNQKDLHAELDLATKEVRRLVGGFEKTLLLNRWDRGAWAKEEIVLDELVRAVLLRLEPLLTEMQVSVDTQFVPQGKSEDLVAHGDSAAIQSAVQAVIENAIFYNRPTDRRVRVEVSRRGSQAVIQVSDTGCGVEAAERELVFERFYRGRHGKKVPGTGLGLFISRGILEAHGGLLRLLEERPLGGASFSIQLPVGASGV